MSKFFQGYKDTQKNIDTKNLYYTEITEDTLNSNFIKITSRYLLARLHTLYVYTKFTIVTLFNRLQDFKNLLVRNLFWGRSSFYRVGTQLLIAIITILVGITGIAGNLNIVNANNYTAEFGTSSDIISIKSTLDSLSGSDSLVSYTIPSGIVKVKEGDTLDGIVRQFLEIDKQYYYQIYEQNLTIDQQMFDRKKNMVQLLNNLKGANPKLDIGKDLYAFKFDGVIHEVKEGDTIDNIAQVYKVDKSTIIDTNSVLYDNLNTLNKGMKLIISKAQVEAPKEDPVIPVVVSQPVIVNKPVVTTVKTTTTAAVTKAPVVVTPSVIPIQGNGLATGVFGFPVSNTCGFTVTQYYGSYHSGVDIAGYANFINQGLCKNIAADGGTVETAQGGWNGGYGTYVILNHGNGYKTLYGHCNPSGLYVVPGQKVTKGQALCLQGTSGQSTGPHLHFEVRYNGTTRNPFSFIPKSW